MEEKQGAATLCIFIGVYEAKITNRQYQTQTLMQKCYIFTRIMYIIYFTKVGKNKIHCFTVAQSVGVIFQPLTLIISNEARTL